MKHKWIIITSWLVAVMSLVIYQPHQVLALFLPLKTSQPDSIKLPLTTKITQDFISPVDWLGSLEIRFNNFYLGSKTELIFRLKKATADSWVYEGQHQAQDFYNDAYYPFGFPELMGVKGGELVFELECVSGDCQQLYVYGDDEQQLDFRLKTQLTKQEFIENTFQDIKSKIQGQVQFFRFYFILIALVLLVLIRVVLSHPSHEKS